MEKPGEYFYQYTLNLFYFFRLLQFYLIIYLFIYFFDFVALFSFFLRLFVCLEQCSNYFDSTIQASYYRSGKLSEQQTMDTKVIQELILFLVYLFRSTLENTFNQRNDFCNDCVHMNRKLRSRKKAHKCVINRCKKLER